jgi:hypothetical protein
MGAAKLVDLSKQPKSIVIPFCRLALNDSGVFVTTLTFYLLDGQ